ncbi:MAG TPA: tetratricopeptide repeat protein, partial [Treponemataceae bacterium]|nr:tetratricopeptide repeat protein [Treponemataceae bacterium]
MSEKNTYEGKKKKRIIAACLGVILLGTGVTGLVLGIRANALKNRDSLQERENTFALINRYIDRGEHDRAMDLLDTLLIQNANDEEALSLSDQVLVLKKTEEKDTKSPFFSVDTGGLESAVEKMAKQSAESQAAFTEALRLQEIQAAQASATVQAEAQKRAEAEAEAKKREAQQKAEAEKRRVMEEELARKNAALQKQIANVNDELAKGKVQLLSGQIDSGLKHFKAAERALPTEETEFCASKLSEISGLLFESSTSQEDPLKKEKLQKEAVSYARKALSYDDNQAISHYVLGKHADLAKDYTTAMDEFTKAVTIDSKNALYYYELGKVQYRLGKYNSAKTSFTSSTKIDSGFENAWFNL